MKELNDLPDMWKNIFSNLSINDLFNCRLVNKQFKYFSDHTDGIYKLIVGHPNLTLDEHYWYYNDKLIEDNDIITLNCFRSIKSLSIFNIDKYLKYLKIYDQELRLEELSNLNNLESLEFGGRFNIYQQIINLNNLKVIASNKQAIKLNAPKLKKIKFKTINQIKLESNPESIKHLITCNYVDELKIFKNLEIIELRNVSQSINENILIIFKNLRQLKINLNPDDLNYSEERIKNSLIKILNDKIKLKKEIDIYLEGVKIKNIDKLNELKSDYYQYWDFRLNNYNLLDFNLSFIDHLSYRNLNKFVINIKNDLPSTFFDKFQYINDVYVSELDYVDDFIWFINNLKCLKVLTIESSEPLGQKFYDNLPNSITSLLLYTEEDINYDFISKFSKLVKFYTDQSNKDLSNLIYRSFSDLKHFEQLVIYGEKNIKIEKNGKKFYLNVAELNFNQLIEEYKKIRLECKKN